MCCTSWRRALHYAQLKTHPQSTLLVLYVTGTVRSISFPRRPDSAEEHLLSEFENMLEFQPVALTSWKFRRTCEGISPRISGVPYYWIRVSAKASAFPSSSPREKNDIVAFLLHR